MRPQVRAYSGLRAPALHEQRGLDLSEHAETGYPEFPQNTLYNRDTYNADKARGQELRP